MGKKRSEIEFVLSSVDLMWAPSIVYLDYSGMAIVIDLSWHRVRRYLRQNYSVRFPVRNVYWIMIRRSCVIQMKN
jgi:hypothetical protein